MIPDEALEGLIRCKESGKTRFIGFSCHDPNAMADFAVKTGKVDVVQTTYSLAIGGAHYRERAVAKLHEAGIGVIAMKVVVAIAGPPKSIDNPVKANQPGLLEDIQSLDDADFFPCASGEV